MTADDKRAIVLNNLKAGELAMEKMYNNLLTKVNSGEVLSKKERETFEELDKDLRSKYLSGDDKPQTQQVSTSTETLKNALDIEQYLTAAGWKIKKSSIYNHIKARKLIAEADGTFTRGEVDRYALANLKKADGSIPQAQKTEADKIAEQAADARRRRELAQAALIENKLAVLQGSFVPRDLYENELAARAAIFRSDGENFFRSQAPAIVNVVSGDQARIPDLIAFCLEAFEQHLARYLHKEEFKVDTSAYEKIFDRADNDEINDLTEDD